MNKASFHSSGRLDVEMLINRFRLQRFVFLSGGLPVNVTGFTWQLNIKPNVGSYSPVLTLSTGGYGLSFPIYETNVIEARFEASQVSLTNIQEREYYWELIRTDTNEMWISGNMVFKYGLLDSYDSSGDAIINISNSTITVNVHN